MFKTLLKMILSLFCDHEFKVITIPITWDNKNSDFHRKGIKPCMLKYCYKCDTTRAV